MEFVYLVYLVYSHTNRTTSGGVNYRLRGIYSHTKIGLPLVEFMYLVFTHIQIGLPLVEFMYLVFSHKIATSFLSFFLSLLIFSLSIQVTGANVLISHHAIPASCSPLPLPPRLPGRQP